MLQQQDFHHHRRFEAEDSKSYQLSNEESPSSITYVDKILYSTIPHTYIQTKSRASVCPNHVHAHD